MPTAMVTFNGRITLPSQVLKQLGLKPGDCVDFVEVEKGRFALQTENASSHGMRSCASKLHCASTIEEMDEALL